MLHLPCHKDKSAPLLTSVCGDIMIVMKFAQKMKIHNQTKCWQRLPCIFATGRPRARAPQLSSGLCCRLLGGGELETERRCWGELLLLLERERLRGLSDRLFLRIGVLDADRERERDLERERERESEDERRDRERERERDRDLDRDRLFEGRFFLASCSLIRRPLRSVLSSLLRAFLMSA